MVMFLQLFDLLDLFLCFAFVNMIKVEYIFLLTQNIGTIRLDKLYNIRTVQFLLNHYLMKFDRIQVMKVWSVRYFVDHCVF